tara:strand:+ start:2278 stop:2625 length:348 start_codon:yes stop_codon:yes gene_type:complete
VELRENVAWRQGHLWLLRWIPRAHQNAPRGALHWVGESVYDFLKLVDALSRVVSVCALVRRVEVPPLVSVHRAEISHSVAHQAPAVQEIASSIAIPNVAPAFSELVRIRRPTDEP